MLPSLVVIESAESTKHELSFHLICVTVRHLGATTHVPLRALAGYHWSDFRWLNAFVKRKLEAYRDICGKCLLFSPWFLRDTLVLHNGGRSWIL